MSRHLEIKSALKGGFAVFDRDVAIGGEQLLVAGDLAACLDVIRVEMQWAWSRKEAFRTAPMDSKGYIDMSGIRGAG